MKSDRQNDVLAHLSNLENRIGGKSDATSNDNNIFVQAPRDVLINGISRQKDLSLKDVAHLARTCDHFHTLFQPDLRKVRATEVCRRVARGLQEDVDELLSSLNRDALHTILTITATIKDYAGRPHTGTALELALKMGDVTRFKSNETMAEMLARHMSKLENGQAIIDAQFSNVFGDDFDAHLAKQQENVYSLDAIVNAIDQAEEEQLQAQLRNSNNDSQLNQTISVFRQQFTERSLREEIYNPYHFSNALDVYNEKFYKWNRKQQDLFWRQIIGYMQRFWPRCWLQAARVGFGNLIDEKVRNRPDRKCDYFDCNRKIPIWLDHLDDEYSRLGYHFGINTYRVPTADVWIDGIESMGERCKILISNKNQSIQNLRGSQNQDDNIRNLGA